jgi:hypothetical protein
MEEHFYKYTKMVTVSKVKEYQESDCCCSLISPLTYIHYTQYSLKSDHICNLTQNHFHIFKAPVHTYTHKDTAIP